MELAVRDCVKCGGDFADSSKYDNCDGIPKYPAPGGNLHQSSYQSIFFITKNKLLNYQKQTFITLKLIQFPS
jgi:hypothetical protein